MPVLQPVTQDSRTNEIASNWNGALPMLWMGPPAEPRRRRLMQRLRLGRLPGRRSLPIIRLARRKARTHNLGTDAGQNPVGRDVKGRAVITEGAIGGGLTGQERAEVAAVR
jgi:hypothetical protein